MFISIFNTNKGFFTFFLFSYLLEQYTRYVVIILNWIHNEKIDENYFYYLKEQAKEWSPCICHFYNGSLPDLIIFVVTFSPTFQQQHAWSSEVPKWERLSWWPLYTTEHQVIWRKSTYNLKFSCWRQLKVFSELILFFTNLDSQQWQWFPVFFFCSLSKIQCSGSVRFWASRILIPVVIQRQCCGSASL